MADGPLVGILVGSESDRERMQGATALLDEAGVGYEFEVRSAHRTPDAVAEYSRSARERGLRVLICGAGLAVRRPHFELVREPPLLQLIDRPLHPLAVGLGADEDPDERPVSHRRRCRF